MSMRCTGCGTELCMEHGTWFDHEDLDAALAFVRAGGLES
jgi:hypothetical protein